MPTPSKFASSTGVKPKPRATGPVGKEVILKRKPCPHSTYSKSAGSVKYFSDSSGEESNSPSCTGVKPEPLATGLLDNKVTLKLEPCPIMKYSQTKGRVKTFSDDSDEEPNSPGGNGMPAYSARNDENTGARAAGSHDNAGKDKDEDEDTWVNPRMRVQDSRTPPQNSEQELPENGYPWDWQKGNF